MPKSTVSGFAFDTAKKLLDFVGAPEKIARELLRERIQPEPRMLVIHLEAQRGMRGWCPARWRNANVHREPRITALRP